MTRDREYLETHPWLTFDVRKQMDRAPQEMWRLLGGATALTEVLADTPLLPDVAREMHMVYLAKGALATTAIEGNTLTEEQALLALSHQLTLPPSKEYLGVEIKNMVSAFNDVMKEVSAGEAKPLHPEHVKEMNRLVLSGLELDPGVVPGEISEHGVVVGAYKGAPRRDCDYLLDRLCMWLEHEFAGGRNEMGDAIIKALLAHLYLAWIHPFGDGNGRTARLVEFSIMCRGGVPAPAAHLLSNHFNDTRTAYYRQLAHASRSGGDVVPFLIYALQGLLDGLTSQLGLIRQQTEQLVWQRLVHLALPSSTKPMHRQRQLAITLFGIAGPVQRSRLPSMSTDLAESYVGTSAKTLTRDIHRLEEASLIVKNAEGYRTNRSLILGLMPSRAKAEDGA